MRKLILLLFFSVIIFGGCNSSEKKTDKEKDKRAEHKMGDDKGTINDMEEEAKLFIREFVEKIEPLYYERAMHYWDSSLTGSEKDSNALKESKLKINKLLNDKTLFEKVKKYRESDKIKDNLIKRQLTILYNELLPKQVDKELLNESVRLSTKIKKNFENFRGEIDGKKLSDNEIKEILISEKNVEKRKKAWEASKQVGLKVAEDVIELVKVRNKIAKKLGYDNYHDMSLDISEQKAEVITKLFDKLYNDTESVYSKIKEDVDKHLAAKYYTRPEYLKPWHYQDPFFQDSPKIFEVDFDSLYEKVDIKKIAEKFYSSIGLDVYEIMKNSDLYPAPNKNQHAFCTDIDRKGDVRILTNLKNNHRWTETLLHELGHAVYSKNIDRELPYLLREEAHAFVTEAIAMLFGRLASDADWMYSMNIIDEETKSKIEPIAMKSLQYGQIIFSRWCQVMYRFERALYTNPDQDLNKLWWVLVKKYQHINPPDDTDKAYWASKIHICLYPAYYHNYQLGEMLASQIDNYIKTKVIQHKSKTYTDNKDVGKYLKERIFAPGKKYHWSKLIEKSTDEPLTPRYYVKQFITEINQ